MIGNIKGFTHMHSEAILLVLIIIFVGISSFFLGRLSITQGQLTHDVLVTNVNNKDAVDLFNHLSKNNSQDAELKYVASKNGTKYYLVWCSGADRIKDSNKMYFKSMEEAESAGYGKASGCNGL